MNRFLVIFGAVIALVWALVGALVAVSGDARADFRICNETSYVIDAAIGVRSEGSVTTRGWFVAFPGQCRVVVQGVLEDETYYLLSRAPDYYDSAVTRFESGVKLCVGSGDFLISNATQCADSSHRLERFIEMPLKNEELVMAESADFGRERAALAGAQRLLGMLGFDAGRIDGIAGDLTEKALSGFIEAANLSTPDKTGPEVYRAMIAELKAKQAGVGLQICNETKHLVWTALGIPENGKLMASGWYKVPADDCVRPYKKPLDGTAIYSFGEAVDDSGPIISGDNIPLIWDGDTLLCTQSTRFSVTDHENCEANGLTPARFRRIDLGGARAWMIRYTEPQ